MDSLENDVLEVEGLIRALPYKEFRRLSKCLHQLSLEQKLFTSKTLQDARSDRRWPDRDLDLLEYMADRWWMHGLGMKLVIISYLLRLSGSGSWPGNGFPESLLAKALPRHGDAFLARRRIAGLPRTGSTAQADIG